MDIERTQVIPFFLLSARELEMTKKIRQWTEYNCKNCAFKGLRYHCMRTKKTCNEVAKEHLRKEKKNCDFSSYEEC